MTDLTAGETVYVAGLGMDCRPTVERVRLLRVLPAPDANGHDCVTVSAAGVRVLARLRDLCRAAADVPRVRP